MICALVFLSSSNKHIKERSPDPSWGQQEVTAHTLLEAAGPSLSGDDGPQKFF